MSKPQIAKENHRDDAQQWHLPSTLMEVCEQWGESTGQQGAREEASACPYAYAGAVVQKKGTRFDRHRSAKRNGDQRKPGHKADNHQRTRTASRKEVLESCNTSLPRERQFAYQLEGAFAVAFAALKPEKIAKNTTGNGGTEQNDEVKQRTREVISRTGDARADRH